MRGSSNVLFALALALASPLACAPAEPARVAEKPPFQPFVGPLAAYLPSPGLRTAVHLRPRRLYAEPGVAAALAPLVPEERFRAFRVVSGVDPRGIEDAWIADYELGTLYLFDAGDAELDVERRFLERASSEAAQKTPDPTLAHWSGVMAGSPSALLRFEGHFVAIAVGDPTLVKIVRAYVERKLKRSPPALASLFLAPLEPLVDDALLSAYATGPFRGDSAVVSGALGVALAARFDGDALRLSLHALGIFGEERQDATRDVSEFVRGRLDTPELRALGAGSIVGAPDVNCAPAPATDPRLAELERCDVNATFSLSDVLSRLHGVTGASLGELAGPPSTMTSTPSRE